MASIIPIGNKFRATVRVKPHKPLHQTFRTYEEADKWGRATEAELKMLSKQKAEQAKSPTVAFVIREYRKLREQSGNKIRPKSNELYQLKRLEEYFGDTKLEDLNTKRLAAFCRKRISEDGCTPYTTGQDLSKLGTVIKMYCSYEELPDPLPVKRALPLLTNMKLYSASTKPRDVVWSDDEIKRVLAYFEANPHTVRMARIFRFAIYTGLRRGEIEQLKWADINEEAGTILVRQAKHPRSKETNNEIRAILHPEVYLILDECPRESEFVFGGYSRYNITHWMVKAAKDLGIEDRHFHDTRHNFVTMSLKRYGANPIVVRLGSGHDSDSFEIYNNMKPQDVSIKRPG